ncbi:MAG TPA: NAD(P)-dependent oxidoreductase [Planctomycetota bacterium]|nr:NAD(P)-dependent oxidoreductase [Planctomycetota bacterium]
MASELRIGWIGTGVMGAPMCGHLMAAGHPATVYNRSIEKAQKLVAKGATWGATPAEVTKRSDIVFTIVGFPTDVRETYLGKNGVVSVLQKGQLVVDMTTSPPSLAKEIAAAVAEKGGASLDAPVSGGQGGAEGAKLTIMVGGDAEAYNKVLPLFQKMGKSVTHLGGPGCGQHCKMVNQILIAGHMLALAESLTYAKHCGINPQTALDAVSAGAAGSWALSNLGPRILKDDFAAGFYVDHFVKDLGIALAEAKEMKLALPMVALAEQLYVALQAQGHGRLGTQAIPKVYEAIRSKVG